MIVSGWRWVRLRMKAAAGALVPGALVPGALVLGALPAAWPGWAVAQESYLQPPATMDAEQRCDYFSRLHRFAEESKSLCDDGRQVKVGPVTGRVLDQCRTSMGARFDRVPVTDMMDALGRQIAREGMGNACHAIGAQVWDLISQ